MCQIRLYSTDHAVVSQTFRMLWDSKINNCWSSVWEHEVLFIQNFNYDEKSPNFTFFCANLRRHVELFSTSSPGTQPIYRISQLYQKMQLSQNLMVICWSDESLVITGGGKKNGRDRESNHKMALNLEATLSWSNVYSNYLAFSLIMRLKIEYDAFRICEK